MISAHIPPGYFERWPVQPLFYTEKNDRYIELIHDFGHVIAFQVYGHTHTDAFRIFADNSSIHRSPSNYLPLLSWNWRKWPDCILVTSTQRKYKVSRSWHLRWPRGSLMAGLIPVWDSTSTLRPELKITGSTIWTYRRRRSRWKIPAHPNGNCCTNLQRRTKFLMSAQIAWYVLFIFIHFSFFFFFF